jgi:hypothetical protein
MGICREPRRDGEQIALAGPDINPDHGPVLKGFGRGNRRGCAKGKDQRQAGCQEVVRCCLSKSAFGQAPSQRRRTMPRDQFADTPPVGLTLSSTSVCPRSALAFHTPSDPRASARTAL